MKIFNDVKKLYPIPNSSKCLIKLNPHNLPSIQQKNTMIDFIQDDLSFSSTLEVNGVCTCETKIVETQAERPKTGRRVRFNESANVAYENIVTENSPAIGTLWYHAENLQTFKQDVIKTAKDNNLGDATTVQYEQTNENAKKLYGKIMLRVFRACCNATAEDDSNFQSGGGVSLLLEPMDEKYFHIWMHVTWSRTGVERLLVRKLHQDKVCRRRELMNTILDLQEMYNDIDDLTCEEKGFLLSNATRKITRPSRLFAAVLGSVTLDMV